MGEALSDGWLSGRTSMETFRENIELAREEIWDMMRIVWQL